MPIPDNNIIQVTLRGLSMGQRILLVRTYVNFGAFPAGTIDDNLQDIIDEVAAGGNGDLQTPYLDALPPEFSLTEIRAQVISPIRSAYSSQLFVAAPGVWAGAATKPNGAAVITQRTAQAGRNQVANAHIGPLADNASVNGILTGAYKTALGALGSAMINEWGVGALPVTMVPVIFHRATTTYDDIENFAVNDYARVMRRRTVGLGE